MGAKGKHQWLLKTEHLMDVLSIWRMDRLTQLGRRHLPKGYWGEKAGSEDVPGRLLMTFDDGPDPHTTPWLLELLARENVQATFFLVGSAIHRHEHLVEKIAQAGHVIGNHS